MAEHFGDVANASFVLQDCLAPVEREVPEVAVPVEGVARRFRGRGREWCGLGDFVGQTDADGEGATRGIALDSSFERACGARAIGRNPLRGGGGALLPVRKTPLPKNALNRRLLLQRRIENLLQQVDWEGLRFQHFNFERFSFSAVGSTIS